MGCGTGILAILAAKLGAADITAIDYDVVCYESTIENSVLNNITNIKALCGSKEVIPDEQYDIILANINRNILLADMQAYVNCLNKGGILLLSGFYEEDIPFIDASCVEKGLTHVKKFSRNNWVSLKYVN